MARQLMVKFWCDVCMEKDGTNVEGRELPPMPAADGKSKVLTLCLPHEQELAVPFLDALNAYGIDNPDKPRRKAGKAPAPGEARRGQKEAIPEGEGVVCELCSRLLGKPVAEATMKNEDSLNVHRGQRHGVMASDYRLFQQGLHEPERVNPETGEVGFAEFTWPPVDDETFVIPAYLHCEGCGKGFDPRVKGEKSAWASLTAHRNRAHKGDEVAA